jgi:hypothetical protein
VINFRLKMVLFNQMLYKWVEVMIGQCRYVAALAADQMMVWGGGGNFVNGLAINFSPNEYVQITKKGQCPVHGGPVDVGSNSVNAIINVTGINVPANAANRVQDNLALRRHAAALFVNAFDVV